MAELKYRGLSIDCRTNKWSIKCDCGHWFDPPTTLLSKKIEACEKCDQKYFVNYNEQFIQKDE